MNDDDAISGVTLTHVSLLWLARSLCYLASGSCEALWPGMCSPVKVQLSCSLNVESVFVFIIILTVNVYWHQVAT